MRRKEKEAALVRPRREKDALWLQARRGIRRRKTWTKRTKETTTESRREKKMKRKKDTALVSREKVKKKEEMDEENEGRKQQNRHDRK